MPTFLQYAYITVYKFLFRRNLDYHEVLQNLAEQGISIRVASPKLVMEEVTRILILGNIHSLIRNTSVPLLLSFMLPECSLPWSSCISNPKVFDQWFVSFISVRDGAIWHIVVPLALFLSHARYRKKYITGSNSGLTISKA